MKKQTIVTGNSSANRLAYAMRTFYGKRGDNYESVMCSRASKIGKFSTPDEDTLLVLKALSADELMLSASMAIDGMLYERKGEDPRLVFPDIVVLVSKDILGDRMNRESLNRRFNIIDLDNEI